VRRASPRSLFVIRHGRIGEAGWRVTQSSGVSRPWTMPPWSAFAKWHYFSRQHRQGKPVEIDWQANVNWRMR